MGGTTLALLRAFDGERTLPCRPSGKACRANLDNLALL